LKNLSAHGYKNVWPKKAKLIFLIKDFALDISFPSAPSRLSHKAMG
jgi:hypothetical protein